MQMAIAINLVWGHNNDDDDKALTSGDWLGNPTYQHERKVVASYCLRKNMRFVLRMKQHTILFSYLD
jgi:hypothetical protein